MDYEVLHEQPQLGTAVSRAPLREVGAHRPLIPGGLGPDDHGHYIGRSYTPLPEFASKLEDAKAAGFGVIHWTTLSVGPLLQRCQTGSTSTRDQPLSEVCRDFAASSFGEQNREVLGRYLEAWITGAPQFARETSNWFIDFKHRRLTNITEVIAGCRARLAMLDQARSLA